MEDFTADDEECRKGICLRHFRSLTNPLKPQAVVIDRGPFEREQKDKDFEEANDYRGRERSNSRARVDFALICLV